MRPRVETARLRSLDVFDPEAVVFVSCHSFGMDSFRACSSDDAIRKVQLAILPISPIILRLQGVGASS